MLKSKGELSSSLKKPSATGTSSVKKKLTFNLVEQLSEDEENEYKKPTIVHNFRPKSAMKSSNTFDQQVNNIKEKYSPMVEFNSGIYLDYYTCKEYNKKVYKSYFYLKMDNLTTFIIYLFNLAFEKVE
jgi:hypothetical protein